MPIEPRATLRFALGLAVAGLIGWGWGGPFAYLLPMLTLALLAPGAPPPAAKQTFALVVILGVSCLWGVLMGPVLVNFAPAGVLLILSGVGLAAFLTSRNPALAVPLKLFMVGNTMVACIAFQSQALALMLAWQMVIDISIAVVIAWGVAVLLPDRKGEAAVPPLPVRPVVEIGLARWIALRSALFMALPLVLALQNPGLFLMTLLNGAMLAQQADTLQLRQSGRQIVTSTAAGSGIALLFWGILGWWPSLVLLVGGMAVIALVAGPWLHGPKADAISRTWVPAALSTMILVLGSTIADSAVGTDIWVLTVRRVTVMIALTVVGAALVIGMDRWWERRHASSRPLSRRHRNAIL
jgi:hypothetical protein